ncbi:uncharacterized protein LOC109596380 isoform X2 [Aethina tumida]|nr:uncharacterized protein LOC109596380 isoform X2 [Aethina tumida]
MKVHIKGDANNVEQIAFHDENGSKIFLEKNNFSIIWQKHSGDISVDPVTKEIDFKYLITKIPEKPFYATVNGKDDKGYKFQRLSYMDPNEYKKVFPRPPLSIEVGESSDLVIGNSLTSPRIYFELTNYGTNVMNLRFAASDEKYLLLRLEPWSMILSPGETKTVTLTLASRPYSGTDTITFKAMGSETIEKKVIVTVGNPNTYDRTDPELDWQYTSDCTNLIIKDCDGGTWTIEVKAKDTGAGLLRLTSNPSGMYFPNSYTTGTTEEVTGYFSGSCCSPDLQITATDVAKNRITRKVNAYRTWWSPGAIAALVLGVLILLAIVCLIIWGIYKCCTTKESFTLPTYRGRY